jgi:omega-hydroxy-beta-dihydromenaquinone-9 sulfotransferase
VAFNLKNFARFTYKSLFKSRNTNYRLTPKRIGVLMLAYTGYMSVELGVWLGFLLDEIFFRDYQETEIKQPVFILGNPRSGTTFLQRLLARDETTFNTMRTWEMLLAPSITMREVVGALSALDLRLGNPVHRLMGMLEETWQEDNVVHKIALRAPEEDEYLLVHIFSTLKIWLYAAMLDETERYTYFDSRMPEDEKHNMMRFYKQSLQRHLYAHRDSDKHYLAKNPQFTPMIDTLYEYFPDIKIIYLVRNPLDMIPSYISLKEKEWRILGNPKKKYASREYVLDMAEHWYRYPLDRLAEAPEESYILVNFNDLVNEAARTVTEIYERFGLEINPTFAPILQKAARNARNHESEHNYTMEEMGLKREQIVSRYRDIFDRFGFDKRDAYD